MGHIERLAASWIGLLGLLVALLAASGPALAAYEVIEEVQFTQSSRTYDRWAGVFFTLNSAQNLSAETLDGPFRLVVVDPIDGGGGAVGRSGARTSRIVNADGNTDQGEPFFEITDPASLASGDTTPDVRIEFARQGAPLAYALRLEREVVSTNRPPRADAGPDQTRASGELVILDGSASSDPDGDRLSYAWSFDSVPAGSGAGLLNPGTLNPSFTVDTLGEYVASLIVSDRSESSVPDTVTISTQNSAPVADAGLDQAVLPGTQASLDGSGSTDVDGHGLSFLWRFEALPPDSQATLSDPSAIDPAFDVDVSGDYVAELVVSDGATESEPDRVTLSTENTPPVADAGDDQTALPGDLVTLDGSYSHDAEFDPLTFHWDLVAAPEASNTALSDPASISPSFQVDAEGEYVAQLMVHDGLSEGEPDHVRVSTHNSRPVAGPGPGQSVFIDDQVVLDGSNSSDADGDPLAHRWALIVVPGDSQAVIAGADSPVAGFVPDVEGRYVAQLIVDDGELESAPATAVIDAAVPDNRPPVIVSAPPLSATVDGAYVYQVLATDPDFDPLLYRLTEAPLGMHIDADTGRIDWTPANAGAAQVSIEVSDGRGGVGPQSYQITVSFVTGARPPVLDPIGDLTAFLGNTLTVDLTASDPDGEPVTFLAEPLPLPDNMRLESSSGRFTFTPAAEQVGQFELTFVASDGRFTDSETVTVTVPAAGGVTRMRGQVITENQAPLPNVRMEIAGVEAFTDQNGDFLLDALPVAGEVRLLVDGSTVDPALGVFATVPEIVHVIEGADNLLSPPIVLLPLDVASADPVDPATTSVITSSRFTEGLSIFEPVTLTIPPGAAIDDNTGQPFVGDIHISRVPDPSLGPRPLPPDIGLSVYIAIQPFGVTYPVPVPVSFPNIEGFPPGSLMDIFALDHDTGAFEKIGEGKVSADGKTVDSIGGVVRSNSWHGIVPQAPQATPEPDADQNEAGEGGSDEPKGKEPCPPSDPCIKNSKPKTAECGDCAFDRTTGNLSEYHALPAYLSLQRARTVKLEYNSNNANPTPIIPLISGFGNFTPPPETMSLEISVGGIALGEKQFSEVKVVPSDIRTQFKTTRPAIQFDATSLETGLHDYGIVVECQFPISFRSETVSGQVIIDNRADSNFGAGWTLTGLQRVHEHQDGRVLLTTGTATSLIFRPLGATDFQSPPGDFTTLFRQADGRLVRRMRTGTEYLFDTAGRQIRETDRNGNVTEYRYDGSGRIERIVDPVGKSYLFSYAAGRIASISDPLGRTTRFQHDAEGNLVRIIEPNGDERDFEYQPNTHLMVAQEDQRDNRTEYFYDFAGRIKGALSPDGSRPALAASDVQGLIDPSSGPATREEPAAPPPLVEEVGNAYTDHEGNVTIAETDNRNMPVRFTDAVGRVTEIERDADSNPLNTTRPNGSVIAREFDARGKTTLRREEFNGATYGSTYDDFSLVTSVTNSRNHQTLIERDAKGNAETLINHLGHTMTMVYDSRGLATRMETPNGLVLTFAYNAQGLVETITETPPPESPGNVRVTTYSYDAAGQTTRVVAPDAVVIDMQYDAKGRLIEVTDNLGQSVLYSYDAYDNLIQTDTHNGDGDLALTVQRAFDNRNRLTETRAPHNDVEDSITQIILDNNSNITGVIDPNANSSSSVFDGEDRLVENTHRLDGITTYEYDTNDRIVKVVAPNGAETRYTYDVLGRVLSEISPDRGTLTYEYDLANNVTRITDGRGISAEMTYDELERVRTKTYPNTIPGKTENVEYIYDNCPFGLGRLCRRIDESGAYDYAYDAFGNLVSMTRTELGVAYVTEYEYDDGDNLARIIYPTGRVVEIDRDGVRRVQAIRAEVNGVIEPIVSDVTYRADDRMTACTFGNGLVDTREYDLQGRLTSQSLAAPGSAVPVDERSYSYDKNSNMLGRLTTPQNSAYAFDALDRLVSDAIDADDAFAYDYDLNGNRLLRRQGVGLSEPYEYLDGSNRLLRTDELSENDLPETPADEDFVYNDANRLFQVIQDGQLVAEYIYNDAGQRTRKILYDTGGTTTVLYHYDQLGYLIAETDPTGAPIREYIWTEGMTPVAQIDVSAGTDRITYLHIDHLMTPRFGTNLNQAVVWRWEGEAFGNTDAETLSDVTVNLRFPGQYFDNESARHYNYFRDYRPRLGRYLQSDPIGLKAGLNAYAYASVNPLRYFDPFGLEESNAGAAREPCLGFLDKIANLLRDLANLFRSSRPKGTASLGEVPGVIANNPKPFVRGVVGSSKRGELLDELNKQLDGKEFNPKLQEELEDMGITG